MAAASALAVSAWDATWEPGDRFSVKVSALPDNAARVVLPPELLDPEVAVRAIEDETGKATAFSLAAGDDGIAISGPAGRKLADAAEAVWLEYGSPHRYRLIVERPPLLMKGSAAGDIAMDPSDLELLNRPAPQTSSFEFDLGLRASRLSTHPGFDRLICLPMVHEMDPLEHQIRTATTVLRRLRGRAMLCDEVGLGKTVEAGLVMSELLMRGLVRSVLVLTPPSLITQWQGEMRRKFAVDLTSHDDPAFREAGPAGWAAHDRMIASIHTAKREPHRAAVLSRRWDLVIVDEAHHLRNRATAAWKFASELRKQFILLLTATPVQNNLEELFNLVTLLEPGLLSTQKDFTRRFVAKGDKLTPRNVDELHSLLSEVMVRNGCIQN